MNKFDDMMAELSERVEGFKQVKLMTRRGVDLYSEDMTLYRSLSRLTVTNCEASRQDDKEAIMSRILDVERFDSHLQDIIFGDAGLMRKAFTGFGLLDGAVRTSRRISTLLEATPEDGRNWDDALE
uniref:Uncharacterized protein n=1 Tax=Alexandrium monilatum TaxID=311494 RepID=A0A7S4T2E7_9DINO